MDNNRDVEFTPGSGLSGSGDEGSAKKDTGMGAPGRTSPGSSAAASAGTARSAGSASGTSGAGSAGGADRGIGSTGPVPGSSGRAGSPGSLGTSGTSSTAPVPSSGTGRAGSGDWETSGTGNSADGQGAATRAKELAGNVRERATEKVEERFSEQKHRATDSLGDVAQSLRTAGEQLPADNGMGRYMSRAANQVDNLASFLNNRDMADLFDEVEDLARRQPAVFVGGAFALGVLGARFLRSSRRNLVDEGVRDRWGTDEMTYRMEDPTRDAVARPNAPGYASPRQRGEGMHDGYTGDRPL